MRKRIKIRFDRLLIIFLVIITVGAVIYFSMNKESEYSKYNNYDKNNKKYGEIMHYQKENVDFYISIYYPKFNIKALDQSITKMFEEWLKEEESLPSKDIIYMDYSSNYVGDQFLSLKFDYKRETENGNITNQHTVLYTYDTKNKKILTIADLLRGPYEQIFVEDKISVPATSTSFLMKKKEFIYYPDVTKEGYSYNYEKYKTYIRVANKSIPSYAPTTVIKKGTQPKVDPNKKMIALTFDNGPSPKYTLEIMKLFKKYNGRATFFPIGENAEKAPKIITKLYTNGFEIANKTYSNINLTKISKEEISSEIARAQNVFFKLTGTDPTIVRPPYGATNQDAKSIFKLYNLTQVIWTFDSYDWRFREANKIAERVINQASDKAIVLMHDTNDYDLEALKIILPTLQEQGYQFVTVSTLKQYT